MRLPANHVLSLAALLIAGASVGADARTVSRPASTSAPTGPAADYPVTLGEPFTIGSTTWTPADQLNYDAVGYATPTETTLSGVSGAHKTLPLPSYVEVTSLDTGRTILVRLVERGPMTNDTLIGLSSGAITQLGMTPGTRAAVRVRRVNPPEVERAALRGEGTVPQRMATPESLLKVLRRKLGDQSPLVPPPATPPSMPTGIPASAGAISAVPSDSVLKPTSASPKPTVPARQGASAKPITEVIEATKAAGAAKQSMAAKKDKASAPKPPAAIRDADKPIGATNVAIVPRGSTVVQVAAFSSRERADAAARKLGGQVSVAGKLWRVRLGPFKGSGEAAPALEKARGAGYRDARIQRAD